MEVGCGGVGWGGGVGSGVEGWEVGWGGGLGWGKRGMAPKLLLGSLDLAQPGGSHKLLVPSVDLFP